MQNDNTSECPYCLETIKTGAIICKHCGTSLERHNNTHRPTQSAKIKTAGINNNRPVIKTVATKPPEGDVLTGIISTIFWGGLLIIGGLHAYNNFILVDGVDPNKVVAIDNGKKITAKEWREMYKDISVADAQSHLDREIKSRQEAMNKRIAEVASSRRYHEENNLDKIYIKPGWKAIIDDGYDYIDGSVVNETTETRVGFFTVTASYKDSSGRVIDTQSVSDMGPVEPGQEKAFRIIHRSMDGMKKVSLSLKWRYPL